MLFNERDVNIVNNLPAGLGGLWNGIEMTSFLHHPLNYMEILQNYLKWETYMIRKRFNI